MSQNASNDARGVRLASLKTIAFICEEVACKDISEQDFQLILSALVSRIEADTGDKDSEEEMEICMEALLNSVEYTRSIFGAGKGEIIMTQIFKAALRPGSEDVRVCAFQCMVEVIDFYENIEPFMPETVSYTHLTLPTIYSV